MTSKAQHTRYLQAAGLPTLNTLVGRVEAAFRRASKSDVESGATWYDEAGDLATSLAARAGSREHAAVVISHLSPRSTWTRNVEAAIALINGTEMPAGVMSGPLGRAAASLESADPLATLNGNKTSRFARNILGDREAVTVDVWALRVVGLDDSTINRKGVYDAIEAAYQIAARNHGVAPSTMQATTWIVARSGRAK